RDTRGVSSALSTNVRPILPSVAVLSFGTIARGGRNVTPDFSGKSFWLTARQDVSAAQRGFSHVF
ncbi:hypothetical protein AB0J71_49795, partial [Nonomuraea sp. NPDC049637]|uniref:hypothetical protein n=1 Tax=Nonomuraea sp. NPDC049637 TaxID=3154356 RepID=UPI003438DFCE